MRLGLIEAVPIETAGALLGLALVDSLSIGTLLIPVWLLMAPGRTRSSRVLLYLGAVVATYFAIGLVLLAGGRFIVERASALMESEAVLIAQLIAGAALLTASFALDTETARERADERSRRSGRLTAWRERAVGGDSPARSLIGLALAAVLIEVASMLPYIAATGVISAQAPSQGLSLLLLAGCCGVMVAPALILTVSRSVGSKQLEEPLSRLDIWLTGHARGTTLWIVGIAGFFLAATAVSALGWIPG